MSGQSQAIQKIIFGSPGTGKSYKIASIAREELLIEFDEVTKTLSNTVKTVFHPEYTYSDFMGKLLPLTYGGNVIYKYYPGHFLQALGMAYKSLLDGKSDNCLLVIDELNRGNAAAIFGSVFQLLDREEDDWSSYELDVSEMELVGLFNVMGHKANISNDGLIQINGSNFDIFTDNLKSKLERDSNSNGLRLLKNLENRKINIPPNLSIIATINTSDESIYYLDSAFKRRWDWQYIDAPSKNGIEDDQSIKDTLLKVKLILEDGRKLGWCRCVIGINEFIKNNHNAIRKIEDKQIGWWFIKAKKNQITLKQVQDKLMFYLWDGVFARNKQVLNKFIEEELNKKKVKLITFADFLTYTSDLVEYCHDSVDADKMPEITDDEETQGDLSQ
jgi:5-methylcytosine-specific restriction enzyme B